MVNLYEQDPKNYDSMMTTHLELKIFSLVANEIKNKLTVKQSKILDLCCGTGILTTMLLDQNVKYIGVDINKPFLEYAKTKINGNPDFSFVCEDALKYSSKNKFDIVVLTSAYHHIKNEYKSQLLKKICNLLSDEGHLIIYEKCIPLYSNNHEFKISNETFYKKRIEYLQRTEPNKLNSVQEDSLKNVCSLSKSSDLEYKINYQYIVDDLKNNNFTIVKTQKVWPQDNIFADDFVGDFIFVCEKR